MGRQQITTGQQIRLLQVEVRKLQTENRTLRKTIQENGRHTRRIEKAYEDALLMLCWRTIGIKPSRRFAALYDITQDRWQNALALLRMARLTQGRSRWVTVELTVAESRLALARDRALTDPEAFFLRHTRHRFR